MKCLYHDDLDGRAAAFCVHMWAGIRADGCVSRKGDQEQNLVAARFIPMTYATNVRDLDIQRHEQIWIVDFSLPLADMDWLRTITTDVTWIDHHKSAIDAYADYPHKIAGIRRDGEAGCVLTWKYLHWYSDRTDPHPEDTWVERRVEREPIFPVPLAIRCVGDRDIWAFELGDLTRNFCMAAECYDTDPGSELWRTLCLDREADPSVGPGNKAAHDRGNALFESMLQQGAAIRKYRDQRAKDLAAKNGWITEFEGHKAFACNVPMGGSELMGGDAAFERAPLLIRYEHKGTTFTVSLYSKTIDCAEICKRHGGGGHKGAAGFRCSDLPFSPID